jgi:hypothetical protein
MPLFEILERLSKRQITVGDSIESEDGYRFELLSPNRFRVTYPSGEVEVRILTIPRD